MKTKKKLNLLKKGVCHLIAEVEAIRREMRFDDALLAILCERHLQITSEELQECARDAARVAESRETKQAQQVLERVLRVDPSHLEDLPDDLPDEVRDAITEIVMNLGREDEANVH